MSEIVFPNCFVGTLLHTHEERILSTWYMLFLCLMEDCDYKEKLKVNESKAKGKNKVEEDKSE